MNRDFLVAVMALRTDRISRPGLDTAIKSWSRNRERTLAQILKESAGLDDATLQALECLASAHLKTHNGDLRLSLTALNAEDLTQDFLTEVADVDPRTILNTTIGIGCESTLPMDQSLHGASAESFSLHPAADAKEQRFQLIRQHAKGGIGQVWLARDSELQRDVAVKEIQPRYAESEIQRARFVLEAEITGNLEHPGIVPVYSLGRNREGRPYYAMRFIRGESLSVAIKRFHKKIRDDAGASSDLAGAPEVKAGAPEVKAGAPEVKAAVQSKWGIEFRQLIGRFLDVCDAMDYAHSRNVLHRDLKPANIMLGPYGETLVVDWGLAKVIGQRDVPQAAGDGDFDPEAPGPSDTTSQGTAPGTTIGTPAYMSPEQAKGLIEELGPASDVYSLGASLYELLTGQVAFHEGKISAVIRKVLAGDFPPPRAVDRSIPIPLEAICLKAMAKEPGDRYDSVRALARDLEHWLADEPTLAHPESRLEQVGRWIRHHRAFTYTAAAALMAIAMVAIVSAVVIDGARRSETVARLDAETNLALAKEAKRLETIARREAEINFDMAQKAVEDYLINVSENTLLKEQDSVDIRSLRQELLQSALTYYVQFAEQRKDDPRLRRQLANAYFRVGQITREIGTKGEAMDAFHKALAIWGPLVDADPNSPELASNLGECYLAMGRLESLADDFPAALEELGHSKAILERVTEQNSAEPRYQASLADCYSETGIALAKQGKPGESLAIHEKARAIQQTLIDKYPDNLAYKRGLAENLNAIGFAYYKQEKTRAALQTFHDVERFCQLLMEELGDGPKPTWLLSLLALTQSNIGNVHKEDGKLEQAVPFFEEALRYRSDLVAQHPSVTRYREKLAVSYQEIAGLEHKAHQDTKAISSIRKSIEFFRDLVRAQPDTARFHSELAWSWDDLGVLHDEARNNTEAMRAFERAVSEQQTAISQTKPADGLERILCYYIDNMGEQYIDLGRPSEGLLQYERALKIRRELNRTHPGNKEYTIDFVKALIVLGNIQRHVGNTDAARELFADARKALEAALKSAPNDPAIQAQLAIALAGAAALLADEAQSEKARSMLADATALFRKVANRAAPADELAKERQRRSEALWDLARILRKLERQQDAARVDAERNDLWKTQPPEKVLDLVLEHLGKATLIGYGKTHLSDRALAVRELDLKQAADDVKLAVERGLKDFGRLKSQPESNTFLLSREDVRSAMRDVESPGSRSGP
jgi:eukaryotic-like serine/threonine-protein kinase